MKEAVPGTIDLVSSLRFAIEQLGLHHARLVVAVSGGADSVALLLGLAELQTDLRLELHAAHLDHRLRPDSFEHAVYVENLAARLGIAATVGAADVRAEAARRRMGLEEVARDVRYGFLGRVTRQLSADAVAVGHTADDQTETRLLHLVRGSGLHGLAGMRPDSALILGTEPPLRVVRPLLRVPRAATEAYCKTNGLTPLQDSTNLDLAYARNRVRAAVIPALRALNPRVDDALERLAASASDAEEFIADELDCRLERLRVVDERGWRLNRAAWKSLPSALKRALLRTAAYSVAGAAFDGLDARSVERGIKAVDEWNAGQRIDWPGGLRLSIERDSARVGMQPHEAPRARWEVCIPTPGRLALGVLPASLRCLQPPSVADAALRAVLRTEPCGGSSRWHLDVDLDAVDRLPLVLRSRRPGDRIAPVGLAGRKKLQDILVDLHVPREERDDLPLVAAGSNLVWIVGLHRDRRYQAGPDSRNVLCLNITEEKTGCPT